MRAYRSPVKLFVFGIVGIILIAAAADVMIGHWVSTPPETTDSGLTTRGQAQQRGDLLWGGAMLVTGVLLFGGSVTELIRRKPTVIVNSDGLVVDTGGGDGFIPWESIDDVSSTVVSDPYDGSIREQLVVGTRPDASIPDELSRDGDTVYIDVHDWAGRVTELALSAQGALDHYRRMDAIRSYEPPSIEWDITVDQPDVEAEPDREVPDNDPEEDHE